MREFKVAFRRLRHQPSFAAAAIITLALGIAAPTALFAVVNATLLRPLPYPRYQDIYTVRTTMTDGRFTIGLVASEEMSALRRATDRDRRDPRSITAPRRHDPDRRGRAAGYELRCVRGLLRSVRPADGQRPGPLRPTTCCRTAAAASSCRTRAWRTTFGGDPRIVGRTIRSRAGARSSSASRPTAFAMPREADLWFAQHNSDSIGHVFDAFVRFRPGLTPAAIQGQLPPMWDELAKKYPDQAKNRVFVMRPLLDAMVGDLGPIVLIAFAATGLLLLLAMVNVANLMLARGTHARAGDRGSNCARRDAMGPPAAAPDRVAADCRRGDGPGLAAGFAWRSSDRPDGRRRSSAGRGYALDPRVFLFSAW